MLVDVVGLGLNAMDTICVLDSFPQPNTKRRIRRVQTEAGGQVATALAACTRFGLTSRYIGSVGDDELGQAQIESLKAAGLAIDCVRVVQGATSQFAVILLEDGIGERTVLWHHDPRLNYPSQDLQNEIITSGRILHLDGCDTAAALQAARWARSAGIPVVVDIDELYDESTEELLRHVDYLIAPETFASKVIGHTKAEEAVRALAARYRCPVAGLTLGDRGAIFYDGTRTTYAPGFKVDVVDTTGAGDVFHGAFIYGVLRHWPLDRIARFANAAAALKCTRFGARRGIPDLADVLHLASS